MNAAYSTDFSGYSTRMVILNDGRREYMVKSGEDGMNDETCSSAVVLVFACRDPRCWC